MEKCGIFHIVKYFLFKNYLLNNFHDSETVGTVSIFKTIKEKLKYTIYD